MNTIKCKRSKYRNTDSYVFAETLLQLVLFQNSTQSIQPFRHNNEPDRQTGGRTDIVEPTRVARQKKKNKQRACRDDSDVFVCSSSEAAACLWCIYDDIWNWRHRSSPADWLLARCAACELALLFRTRIHSYLGIGGPLAAGFPRGTQTFYAQVAYVTQFWTKFLHSFRHIGIGCDCCL